ncbi:PAS domain-containing protein [Allorhizobium pseudoryzae]|uniref:PAS domain-containing protein n=1 Tax=Allorhizobium pseudoryzae TaxID=379684 RepID=UPI003D0688D2
MLEEQKSHSSVQETATQGPFQITDTEVVEIFSTFNVLGHWRNDLETGLVYCCKTMLDIFGFPPSDGPVSMVDISARLHPDDLTLVMEAHEAASAEPMHFQKIHRIQNPSGTYRWYCSAGRFRTKEGTIGEIVGITWEIPPQRCEAIQKRMNTI